MTAFSSLKIVGGLLPADLLGRVSAGDPQVPGTGPQTYGLERGESVRRQASRSWLYLLEVWQDFKRRVEGPGAAEAVSARVTRERWLRILLRELGFHEMAGGGFELEGKSFPVSHRAGHVPVHLLGWATDLDHKTPHVAARAPQSMLQELLNRDDAYLWAILSNGATLRLLRDSTALVGSSYVEFDLEAIFDGELFSDFVLLYLTCHESRFAIQGDGGPASCYLEQWRGFAAQQGERALDQLRNGVQQAISILGTGFLSHPANPHLRGRLDPGSADLKLDDFNRALLRLVYRMLFWFVAEDRGALLQPDPDDADTATRASLRQARDRYAAYFSSARLRQLARRHRGSRHGDLFDATQLVFDALGTEGGVPELALPGIGGIFESQHDDGTPLPLDEPLAGARLSNEALLGAVRALSLVKPRDGGAWRPSGLRQPGRRRTRQRLRIPAGTDPPLRPRAARLHAGDTGRQRAERVRLLLHPNVAGRMPPGLRARPAARRGLRPRDAGGTGLGAAGHHRLRPRLRIRPLPRRRRPPDRQAHRRRGNRRVRAARRQSSGQPCAESPAAASTASTSTPWPPS